MSTWIGDGYEKGLFSQEASVVQFGTSKRGTPFNIRLDAKDKESGDKNIFQNSYYCIAKVKELKEGALGVGIVKEEEFLPGWKCRGMFYNGNLTNGSAALLIGFGDFIKCGDEVGVFVNREINSTVEMIVYLNGRCLGSAFKIDSVGNECYYPCLHIDGDAKVDFNFIKDTEGFPTVTKRQASNYKDKYSGDWLVKTVFVGPELSEYPQSKLQSMNDLILSLGLMKPDKYNLSIKVGNTLRTSLHIIGQDDAFDKVEVGNVMSTMMMSTPDQREMEQLLSSSLPTIYKSIVNNEQLILTGPTIELICERHEKQFPTLNKY